MMETWNDYLVDQLNEQVLVEPQEYQLKMLFEELFH